MRNPKITLITVVRNGIEFVERCLASVEAQSYDNIEYIVMDGASTDGTQAVIERYKHVISYYQSAPDNGPYDAAMQGISHATGEMVGFLMVDDWLAPDALATIAQLYQQCPEADIACFAMQEYHQDEAGTLTKTRLFCDPEGDVFDVTGGLYCHGLNRFFSRRILEQEIYARDDKYPQLADRDFYVRLGLRGVKKTWTDKVLYHVVVHAGSNSTGGSSAKVSDFLEETSWIARDHLQDVTTGSPAYQPLLNWYCFNKIRRVWFLLKSGQVVKAVMQAVQLLLRYPLATICHLRNWRIPEAYRPQTHRSQMS
jgi:glycosyltransferase involved in cell wall biosynthesis